MDTLGRLISYCGLLFSSFFRWWWAVIAGFASIASFLAVPGDGITVTPFELSLSVLFGLTLLFLTATTVYQGWLLSEQRLTGTRFSGICSNDQYLGGLTYLLDAALPLSNGVLVELRRHIDGAEVVIAVLEVVEVNARGQLQAQAVWTSPGHLRELRLNKVQWTDLTVSPILSSRTLSRLMTEHVD